MFPRFSVTPCCKQISAANAWARNVSPQILTISFQPRRAGLRSRIVHVFILPIHPSVFPLRSPISSLIISGTISIRQFLKEPFSGKPFQGSLNPEKPSGKNSQGVKEGRLSDNSLHHSHFHNDCSQYCIVFPTSIFVLNRLFTFFKY